VAPLAHRRDAADQPGDDALLALLGAGEVDLGIAALDAEVARVVDVALDGGGLEERLGRDAAPVEAGATQRVLLDHRDVEARRRPVQGGRVPTGPTADDDQIEVRAHRRSR
jgi:hypothetical protein